MSTRARACAHGCRGQGTLQRGAVLQRSRRVGWRSGVWGIVGAAAGFSEGVVEEFVVVLTLQCSPQCGLGIFQHADVGVGQELDVVISQSTQGVVRRADVLSETQGGRVDGVGCRDFDSVTAE